MTGQDGDHRDLSRERLSWTRRESRIIDTGVASGHPDLHVSGEWISPRLPQARITKISWVMAYTWLAL